MGQDITYLQSRSVNFHNGTVMTEISNPHDRFFKEVLSRPEAARDFVVHYLPDEVTALLDLDSLEVTKDSFVDKDLREHFSDLLYRFDLADGSPGFIYLLFEHKSYSEPLVGLHLLRYMIKIWEQTLKQGETKKLPPILPVVVYHGRSKWKVRLDFAGLFDCPEAFKSYIPDFRYLLCDLTRYSDEEIKGAVILRTGLLLLKHIFSDDLGNRLPNILGLLGDLLEKRSGLEYLETVLKYVASGTYGVTEETLKEAVIEGLKDKGGHIMPTLAEKWIEQGIQEGIQQGVLIGQLQSAREAVIENLDTRFGVVPRSIINTVDEIAEITILKILLKKSIIAESLDQFADIMRKTLD
jgi:predicted transposase/invertase (TIGR01784 family)